MATRPPLDLRQKLVLAVIVTLAAALRLEGLGETSLAHFDEGVLAANGLYVWTHGPLKFQLALPLQAPPLFPWLIAAAHALLGSDWIILGKFVSAALAVATVPLVFLLGRRLQGNAFGLAAAALLAASDLHIAYSRMALTDAPLTFFFTLAIYCLLRLYDAASELSFAALGRGFSRPIVCWTLLSGLAAGAAWETKYNGWMSLAAAGTALALVVLRDRLRRTKSPDPSSVTVWRVAAAFACATIIAGLCFAPWVWFVNRAFAGGYAAVTSNHWSYFGGPDAWPGRAWRLCESLPAFRHYGWLLTLAAGGIALVRNALHANRKMPSGQAQFSGQLRFGGRAIGVAISLAGLLGAMVLGADAMALLLAIAAIGPALAFGRFEHVLLAVWLGAFVVMTPFYHPYTRLLTPALPAAILLALWLLDAAWDVIRRTAETSFDEPLALARLVLATRASTAIAVSSSLAIFFAAHPFGWIPSSALWQRWSTRESYRGFGLAIDEHTPSDAFVLCQALPPMPLYCPREMLPIDRVPFTELLSRAPAGRPAYLAVDEWGAYASGHDAARETLLANRECLERVAATPNDLNIVALLDNLSPEEVAEKLAGKPAAGSPAAETGENFLPPRLQESKADVILLYRIDRECVRSLNPE